MFRLVVGQERLLPRICTLTLRCLCSQSAPRAEGSRTHEDRTKLEGDMYDESPDLEAQRAEQKYQEQQEEEDAALKRRILSTALRFVPQHGWTTKAISAGTEAEGFPSVTHGIITRGPIELVHHFYETANVQLASNLATEVNDVEQGQGQKKKTGPFVRDALVYRLQLLTPYLETWPQAMGLMALPQNAPSSLSLLSHLVDDIWYYAGDRSTDFNYYTKRLTLAAVYKSTELHLLQDKSTDYEQTWAFLDRRINDLGTVGKGIRQVQDSTSQLGNLFYGASIVAGNILGVRRH